MKKKLLQDEYLKYKTIANNDIFYDDLKNEYDLIIKEKDSNEELRKTLKSNFNLIRKNILNQNIKIERINSLKYNSEKFDFKLDILNQKLEVLKKHPFLNKRKIKEIEENIKNLKITKKDEINKFDLKNKDELVKIDIDLEVMKLTFKNTIFDLNEIKRNRNIIDEKLNKIKNKLNEYYFCDDINKIENLIKEAKLYISNNKIDIDYNLDYKIEQIKLKIYNIESNINNKVI